MDKMNSGIVLFEQKTVRRTWYKNQWWFVVEDVVLALIDSSDAKQYIQRMKQRDEELLKGWVQIVHTLSIKTHGGSQKMNCANTEGLFRIIQSIPSPKAEPFKLWLAKIGYERTQEIQNPELAMERMKLLYEKKGYPKTWINKRMRGIAVRQDLTSEWQARGAQTQTDFAILTNEIMTGAFGMGVKKYKDFKKLDKPHNLRDHMTDIELILTMLAEATTTKLHQDRDTQGLPKLKRDAKNGGSVAGRTKKDIEKQTGKPALTKENYLHLEIVNRKKQLAKESKLAEESSLEVLREFEALDDPIFE